MNQINKLLPGLTKKKRVAQQIKSGMKDATTDITEIQRIPVRDYASNHTPTNRTK